jgi:microsomal dipeptidase-like Zn-dependent dipeptidase
LILPLLTAALAAPAPGYVDLHIHLAAHLAVPVYGPGPDRAPPARRTHEHAIEAQLFTEDLVAPGPSILVSLAYANLMNAEFVSRRQMRAHMERQLAFVEDFCLRHAERFGLARTPDEARSILASGRTAVVHGIEGATKILDDADDARAWADRGVAVITPVHLADNAIGGSWCQPGVLAMLNVPGCWREALAPRRHGLTPFGTARIGDLIDAGIVVDLAHMAHAAFAEAIPLLQARRVAPVFTHVTAASVRRDPVALTDDELRQIYALGGLVGVTANLSHLSPKPPPATPRCPGSIDDFRLQWDHVVGVAAGAPVAWGSDFQGGVDHPRPKYGPKGCEPAPPGADTFDVEGLVHAGLVEPMFEKLAGMGSDRGPLDASAERFLTIWETARAARR